MLNDFARHAIGRAKRLGGIMALRFYGCGKSDNPHITTVTLKFIVF